MNAADARAGGDLLIERTGRIEVLTINRPDALNALTRSLRRHLADEFMRCASDPGVWVIVLTGAGDHAFSAGADLKEFSSDDAAGVPFPQPTLSGEPLVMEVIAETLKRTIAALNGLAVGGGLELALACDIRIAATGVKLGMPEAKVGLGGVFGSVVLPRRLPPALAFEMLYTGDFITAEDAARWGLINHVVLAEELLPTALALARKIEANAPLTVRRMKEIALKGLELPVHAALRLDVGPNPYTSRDREEGIKAFLEKRPPKWEGR